MKQLKTNIDKAQVTSLCADAISELERAVRIHPMWPAELSNYSKGCMPELLKLLRDINDNGTPTGYTIFKEEFIEFIEASMKPGNQVAARIELVQTMAMLIRISCHLNDYVPQRATERTEVQP
jgi:hypothetical protein